MKKQLALWLAVAVTATFVACDSDDDSGTSPVDKSAVTVDIDATDYENWVYFSFDDDALIAVADPQTSLDWDLGFRRYHMRTNSGSSGSGQGGAYDAGKVEFSSVTTAPDAGFVVDDSIWEYTRSMPPDSFQVAANTLLDEWYEYVFQGNAPTLVPREHVYVIKTADGKYAKIMLTDYYDAENVSGNITMQYLYNAEGGTDLTAD
jgi:hypothetical protein